MRKYRGLTKEGKWVYGWYSKVKEHKYYSDGEKQSIAPERHFIIQEDSEYKLDRIEPQYVYDISEAIEVISKTVGQFTGLKDKNCDNSEVYGGDLLAFWFGKYRGKQIIKGQGIDPKSVCVVEMVDGCWVAGDEILSEALEYKHICGNIHQKPELMEQE